jgi:hydroxymethylglutaryl-CoA reductase (NADPH)
MHICSIAHVLVFLLLQAVHIVFLFSTGDACGQNVATVCAESIMHWITENAPKDVCLNKVWIEANVTSDKKPGAFNILHGRGMSTEAKVILSEEVINKYLQTTSENYLALFDYATRISLKTTAGGGFHANPANTLTALYLATGQDPAAVADSIAGTDFTATKHDGEGGGMEITLRLQNLLVGSVGGGTALPTQSEGLEMLGCKGAGKVRKFAEIATAFCLALDISSTSAVSAGIFASGHNKLGRNRPT